MAWVRAWTTCLANTLPIADDKTTESLQAENARLIALLESRGIDWCFFAAFETMAGHAYIDRYRASLGMRMEL
jgi:hypothetical protein